MRNAVDMALFVLNKYYRLSEAVPAYTAAILLDPSKRKQYMKKTWAADEMHKATSRVQAIWEAKYKNLPTSNELQHQHQTPHKKGKRRELSAFDKIQAELSVALEPEVEDDFLSFINAAPIPLGKIKPIQWWCLEEQRKRYPRLHQMALDILSIPPMSDAPERTFSCGRRTIPWSRARLKSKNIIMVESLSNWVSQGLIPPNQGMEELLDTLCEGDIDSDSSNEEY
jgi:hypothetical protein